MNKTGDDYINRILKDIDRRRAVDYGDKNSVRRYNAAMERIIRNAKYIDAHFPEELEKFVELCDHPDVFIVDHCTDIVFMLDNTTYAHKVRSFNAMCRRLNDKENTTIDTFIISQNIIKCIEEYFPMELSRFILYLESPNHSVVICCAARIFSSKVTTKDHKLHALRKLQQLYMEPETSPANKLIISRYLETWENALSE